MTLTDYLSLRLGFFNINGFVGQKTHDPGFSALFTFFDILALTETWHSDGNCIKKVKNNIPSDYLYIHNPRKNKDRKSKRNSGGIIIFYRKHLHKAINIHDKETENMLWIKIKNNYLNLDKDLYIGTIYNSPINSTYTKKLDLDFYQTLLDKMTSFSRNDYVLIGGDFNSRTGTIPDYVNESENDTNFINLPQEYDFDKFTKTRNNQDIHINSYGEKLIDFTITTKMRILNGRTLGDYIGKFTYIGHNGVSVVDYVLASEAFLLRNYIHSFTVDDLTTLSDHRPLQLHLKNTIIKKQETDNPLTQTGKF